MCHKWEKNLNLGTKVGITRDRPGGFTLQSGNFQKHGCQVADFSLRCLLHPLCIFLVNFPESDTQGICNPLLQCLDFSHRTNVGNELATQPLSRFSHHPDFIPPTPQQLEILDKRILKWSRQILRLTPTFPAAVLASPHMIHIPMPSDTIHTSQLRCFWRSQIRGPAKPTPPTDSCNGPYATKLFSSTNCPTPPPTNPHPAPANPSGPTT